MSEIAIEYTDTLVVKTCGKCGVVFGLPRVLDQEHQTKGGEWFCPNGHSRVYRETEVMKLRRELEEEQRRTQFERTRRKEAERQTSAARGQVTKLRRRVAVGVCPCCHRTFRQLAAHMKTQHPTYPEVP